MNKTELIEHIAKDTGTTKVLAGEVVESALTGIKASLASGDEVALSGFGIFKPAVRPAREGRNPATGEPLHIAESTVAKFTASKTLKEMLNA